MDSGFGYALGRSLAKVFLLAALIVFCLGAIAMWGVPKLWELIKPLIHSFTA